MSLAISEGSGALLSPRKTAPPSCSAPTGTGFHRTLVRLRQLVANQNGTYTYTRREHIFNFSATGQLLSESDPNGYLTTLAYGSSGQLTTVTDPAGRQLSFSYGSNGLVSAVTSRGASPCPIRTTAGRPVLGHRPGWRGDVFYLRHGHLLLTVTNPNGQPGGPDAGDQLTNTYNSSGQVTEQVDPMGRDTYFAYSGNNLSPAGGTTTITDPDGDVTMEDYASGALLSITQGWGTASAATTNYEVDPESLSTTEVTDPDGHTTTYTYDADGDVLTKEDALNKTWTYTYNSLGEVLTSQTPDQAAAGAETRTPTTLTATCCPPPPPSPGAAPPPPPTRTARAAPPRATLAT